MKRDAIGEFSNSPSGSASEANETEVYMMLMSVVKKKQKAVRIVKNEFERGKQAKDTSEQAK